MTFDFIVLETLKESLLDEWLIKREQWYVDLFETYYNINSTAGNCLGIKRSKETKDKIREFNCKYLYTLFSTDGEKVTTDNLNGFAKERGLDHGALYNLLKGKNKHHKGWHDIARVPFVEDKVTSDAIESAASPLVEDKAA